ncbi:hypothetical protein C2E31_23250 [Rhodopirellula baltica]|nr:hypothetical protein C2E31_23250 [Rhodopirellula baltica]
MHSGLLSLLWTSFAVIIQRMPLPEINPYAPTDSDSTGADDRSLCPVCAQRVEFARYVFPFGFCPGCGNYLAVRNWN